MHTCVCVCVCVCVHAWGGGGGACIPACVISHTFKVTCTVMESHL